MNLKNNTKGGEKMLTRILKLTIVLVFAVSGLILIDYMYLIFRK